MKTLRRILCIALIGALPGLAAAQSIDELVDRGTEAGIDRTLLETVSERAEGAGLDVAETARLIEPGVALAEQGLPAQAVVQRALEGLAKNVPSEQITQVVDRLQQATERAGQAGDRWLERPEVQRMLGQDDAPAAEEGRRAVVEGLAQAYVQSAPDEALEAALERMPAELPPGRASAPAVGAALQVLADLPVSAEEPGLAAGLLVEALNTGFSASDLRRLPAALDVAQQRGEMPAEAVARGALSQMAEGTPAASVLENLFQGEVPGQPPGGTPPGLDRRPQDDDRGGPPDHVPGGGGGNEVL